ncbi:MAG: beta-ketoacyl-[acyl-carrier-protein] synthase family protein [bacterium]
MSSIASRRAVITGMGVVSALGSSVDRFWSHLCQGVSGVHRIDTFEVKDAACQVAATVSDLDLSTHFNRRERKSYDRFTLLGLAAAEQAWDNAYLGQAPFPERMAVLMGTGIGGISSYTEPYHALYGASPQPLNAYTIPRIMNSSLSAAVAIRFGLHGPNLTLNTACSSGANALGQALQWIRSGKVERVLCGGSEAPVTHALLRTWESLGVLVRDRNETPEAACRPFDQERSGFVLAEGAAVLVLESLESALRRGAPVHAELVGYGANCDAKSLTHPDRESIAEAMRLALEDGGLFPDDIDAINAHGTGTRINDPTEAQAIREVCGPRSANLPVTANKSMLGHSMGASSALEAVASVLMVREQQVPPTRNCTQLDPECPIDPVADGVRPQRLRAVLSNSFGFGGSNAVLAFTPGGT